MKKKTIYLANPYGFSTQQRVLLLPPFVDALEALRLEVWEPFSRNNQESFAKKGWEFDVGRRDLEDIVMADAIFAIVNGCPPDEGVMVELGVAIALKKPTFLFRDDFRRCSDGAEYPLNLMLFTGMPKDEWKDYFYESLLEIACTTKALAAWSREGL